MARIERPGKGASLFAFPDEYVVVDLETTGTSAVWDKIIEIGAARVKDGQVVSTFQELVQPGFEVDEFIEGLTGITNDMLAGARGESKVVADLNRFIEATDVLVGHNIASFDANFLYDAGVRLGAPIVNDHVDTMRIAKKLHGDWNHHRLTDLCEHFAITNERAHRALADADATRRCFEIMRQEAADAYGSAESFCQVALKRAGKPSVRYDGIEPTVDAFDATHLFYGKEVSATGAVDGDWPRQRVAQAVVNRGGRFVDKFKKKTTQILIVGDYGKCRSLGGKLSSQHRNALEMQAKGKDILILSPDAFFDLVEE